MECDTEADAGGGNCNYDGAYIGADCSEGLGVCVKQCTGWFCDDLICDTDPSVYSCIYPGVAVGQPCSSTNNEFTVGGEGECILFTTNDIYQNTGYITYYNTGCDDGTDGCCTEPTCDEPFTLSLEYIDASTLQVNYSSTAVVGGFQFEIVGATTTGGSGGDADANGLVISTSNSLVIGFSFGGSTIPAGQGILTNLTVTIDPSTENLCLENVVPSDPSGNQIVNCPEYTALWPAPGQQVECIIP